MTYKNSNGTAVIDRKNEFSSKFISTPTQIAKEFDKIDEFVNEFDDYLVGYAALFAGLSVEKAKAAGAH